LIWGNGSSLDLKTCWKGVKVNERVRIALLVRVFIDDRLGGSDVRFPTTHMTIVGCRGRIVDHSHQLISFVDPQKVTSQHHRLPNASTHRRSKRRRKCHKEEKPQGGRAK